MDSENQKPSPGQASGGSGPAELSKQSGKTPGSEPGSLSEARPSTLMKSFPLSGASKRYICLHQVSDQSLACLNHRNAYELWEGNLQDVLYARIRLRSYRKVKVVASPENVPLILALYEMKLRDELASLQVCSPSLISNNWRRLPPADLLYRAAQTYFSPSCGGFHEFTEINYPSYALRAMVSPASESGFKPDFDPSFVRYFVEMHPLYFLSVSLPHLHFLDLARLVAEILDPRFFVDIYHTERYSKLYGYFGLFPTYVRKVLNDHFYSSSFPGSGAGSFPDPKKAKTSSPSSSSSRSRESSSPQTPSPPSPVSPPQSETPEKRYLRRCQLVYDCSFSVLPNDSQEEAPQFFLWREQRRFGGGIKGTLRALQKFLRLISMIWKDQLYKNSNSWKEPLFVPEYFFDSSDEISWFRSIYN